MLHALITSDEDVRCKKFGLVQERFLIRDCLLEKGDVLGGELVEELAEVVVDGNEGDAAVLLSMLDGERSERADVVSHVFFFLSYLKKKKRFFRKKEDTDGYFLKRKK